MTPTSVSNLALRLQHTHVMRLPAPPEAVFPLLCPVREREWLAGWEARMVHSISGVAEPGCVFATPGLKGGPNDDPDGNPEGAEWIWVLSRHEAARAVQFVVHAPGSHVTVLDIQLEPEDAGGTDTTGGTRAAWTYTLTALEPAREAFHRGTMAGTPARLVDLEARLAHFLRTGRCLPGTP